MPWVGRDLSDMTSSKPQSQSLGLPSAASRFPEMLPSSSWSWAQTIFLHCQKPHHQSLTNSCSGRTPSRWTHGSLWAYTSNQCSAVAEMTVYCTWLAHSEGVIPKAAAIGQEAQGLESESQDWSLNSLLIGWSDLGANLCGSNTIFLGQVI